MPRLGFWSHLRLCFLSLCYNDHLSWSYVLDTALEPLFWFADHFAKVLGPIFVCCVILLNSFVIGIAYLIGLPHYWSKSIPLALVLLAVGNLLLVNVVFHYVMAFLLGPGEPPRSTSESSVAEVTSICKKCIAPKPPRTHHCSVCERCVLKMDHHCPWLNSCVGHRNHRHFFLYMSYTVLGCLFIMIFGFEIVWDEIINPSDESEDEDDNPTFFFYSRHTLVGLEAFLTTGTFLILGSLTAWHAKLISKGETSIEAHINRAETKRLRKLGRDYRNPYDFTAYYNWCLFLGLIEGRSVWRGVLLPSRHPPKGDGLSWDTVYNCDIQWNDEIRRRWNRVQESEAKIA